MSGGESRVPFGFLNIRKPAGMTAHDVVAVVRRTIRVKQVGHGGTLDPMATGVLPIAVGKACRLLRFLEGRKVYLAEIKLGESRSTDDIEGEILTQCTVDRLPDEEAVQQALQPFRGTITQTPPVYSAVHVGGKRLYQMARAGEEIEHIPERTVVVHQLDAIDYVRPVLKVRVACSAGTYIRSIARDLGKTLGCGGCLQSLIREQAGPFLLEHSITLEELKEGVQSDAGSSWAAKLLMPPQAVLAMPKVNLDNGHAAKLRMGQTIVVPAQLVVDTDGRVQSAPAAFDTTAGDEIAKNRLAVGYTRPSMPCVVPVTDPSKDAATMVMALLGETLVAVCRQIDTDPDNSSDETTHAFKRLSPEVVLAT